GGVIENLPRVMPQGATAVLKRGSWRVPAIFDLIEQLGKIDRGEMDRTFNNGIGMAAIVPASEADRIVAHLRRRHCGASVIGEVRRGKRGVTFA
ncbi:MAG TPA: AIR synthase-related protein, partial [Candidatus Binataceae bacterium]